MSIVILDESVASQIAAGEVVERPASVVKELVENSLDAGATHVEVEIEEGGRRLIRVTDDGCGMTREDTVLSLQRHATSKIRSADDLSRIATFGFRGEALPSIASVSHLTLVSRTSEAAVATRISAAGGRIAELEDASAPPGTRISVGRLFYNTPARLKFLKSDTTEFGHIVDAVTRFLFSNPGVAFRLTHDGREVLQRQASSDLGASVSAAWGRQVAEAMVPVELELPGMAVRGLASGPSLHRASRSRELLYINGRWVRSRTLSHAVEQTYRGVLPERRFPTVVLLVTVDPGSVDVNVHPTKSEVRLSREWEVRHLVAQAVRQALGSTEAAPGVELSHAHFGGAGAPGPSQPPTQQPALGAWPGMTAAPGVLSPGFRSAAEEGLDLRPLAQLRQTYILVESNKGLIVVDQHRAQERVLYETFAEARLSRRRNGQALLEPAVVQLGVREAAATAQQMEELSALGFELEPFGSDAFLIRAVPAELARDEPVALVRDLAEGLAAETGEKAVARRREQLLITLSCRSAVKAGDALSREEMVELLRALAGTARPYTCPHGWPIVMTISNFEIDRKFNR